MRKLLRHLRHVEKAAYPAAYRQMQQVKTMGDLREYCEGEPRVWTWDGGYCIASEDELVDLASTETMTLAELRRLQKDLTAHFCGRTVTLDAREGTSMRLLRFAERRGLVEIIASSPYEWAGEIFHEMEVRFMNLDPDP